MLTALQLGNFKAFAETQRVPLRPLTFLYGVNSAGKSSVIHGLILAHHAMQTGEFDAYRTAIGGESVDLGGFRQFVHRRDATRKVEWSAVLDASRFTGRLADLFAPVKTVCMSVYLGIALDNRDKPLPDAAPEIHGYDLHGDETILLRMSRRRNGKLQLDFLNHEHPVLRKAIQAMVGLSSTTDALHPEDYEVIDAAVAELVPEMVATCARFVPDGLATSAGGHSGSGGEDALFFPVSIGRREEDPAAAIRSFLPRAIHEILKGVAGFIDDAVGRLQYLGPLRSYPPRHIAFTQHHDSNWFAGGGYAWDVVRNDASVRKMVNNWLGGPERLQTPYELFVRTLVGLDQIENPVLETLERIVEEGIDIEYEPESEETLGGPIPFLKNPEKDAAKLVETLRRSDIEKLTELILIDRRSDTVVSHRDVGFGISQVLPVLVAAYAAENRIIAIEQPEIHLHPKLQAELGDVFINATLGGRRNTILIETHSENLLLRVMKRMRQTFENKLPEGVPQVRPEDVMVLYVEPDGKRSIIREMPLNERGELIKAWPGGFFEEGLEEIF